MDKICRGSYVGEVHRDGGRAPNAHDDIIAGRDNFRRGTHISTRITTKLDNTGGTHRPRTARGSDTTRSSDWFRHDSGYDGSNDIPELRSNFHRSHKALGAASQPTEPQESYGLGNRNSTTSRKSLAKDENTTYGGFESSPRGSNGLDRRPAGVGSAAAPIRGQSPSQFDGALSPRDGLFDARRAQSARAPVGGARSPREPASPRTAWEDEGSSRRVKSPTYTTSENWMGYSQGVTSESKSSENLMPSRNWSSSVARLHSGRTSQNSSEWHEMQKKHYQSSPQISNAVDNKLSAGIKTNIAREPQNMRNRLQLDYEQPEIPASERRCERRHMFTAKPPVPSFRGNMSPRQQQSPQLVSRSPGRPVDEPMIDNPGQRSSSGMVASMDLNAPDGPNSQPQGRRGHEKMMMMDPVPTASRSVLPAPAVRRDHRNSDIMSSILTHPVPVSEMPQQINFQPTLPSSMGIYSFGESSALPSTINKEEGFMQSGLKMVKFGARNPGFFSPQMTRMPIAHAMPPQTMAAC